MYQIPWENNKPIQKPVRDGRCAMVICTWRKFLGSWGNRCAMRWGKFIDFGASYPPDSYLPLLFATDATLNTRFTGSLSKKVGGRQNAIASRKDSCAVWLIQHPHCNWHMWYIYIYIIHIYIYIWYMRHLNDVVNFYILEYVGSYFGKKKTTIWDISTFKSFGESHKRHP